MVGGWLGVDGWVWTSVLVLGLVLLALGVALLLRARAAGGSR